MDTTHEVWTLNTEGVQAVIAEVGDTTEVFDTVVGAAKSKPLPGSATEKYIPFGADDQLLGLFLRCEYPLHTVQ